jgi:hypothetical protein
MRSKYPLPSIHTRHGYYLVLSHKKRMMLNHAINWACAHTRSGDDLEFIKSSFSEKPGWTMQPQDMIVWKGMELLCYSRRGSSKNTPTTGAVYVVDGWDGSFLTVSLHDDYLGEALFNAPAPEQVAEVSEDESDPEELEEIPARAPPGPDRECTMRVERRRRADGTFVEKKVFRLTYRRASEILRPQHALVYAAMQRRTLRSSVVLLDLDSGKVTMRDVITAMSRPTKGSDLHFATSQQQQELFKDIEQKMARNYYNLKKLVDDKRAAPESQRVSPSRVGRA